MPTEPAFQPKCADYAARVSMSFSNQPMMSTIGARLSRIEPGLVDVEIPFQHSLTQHNGFLHGGALSTLADTACGYAAYSLMPENADVLTIELKLNFLAPAIGERVLAEGRVIRAGRNIIVSAADVFSITAEHRKHVATMLATLMCVYR